MDIKVNKKFSYSNNGFDVIRVKAGDIINIPGDMSLEVYNQMKHTDYIEAQDKEVAEEDVEIIEIDDEVETKPTSIPKQVFKKNNKRRR